MLKPGLPISLYFKENEHDRLNAVEQKRYQISSGQSPGAWRRLIMRPETSAARGFTDL
jgi:hypothetical protein